MTEKDLVIYYRRLPHWRLDGSVYFVTWRLAPNQIDLTADERGELMLALKHFDGRRYELYAGVVMHDHVHVLAKPLGNQPLQEIIHSWKSFTAHKSGGITAGPLLSGKTNILTVLSGMSRNFWIRYSMSSITP
ncbi:MAG TPA: hypothetical protein VJA64_05095 [Desulfobaccales bacterium]|jgi:REP element-mobilizing transposase RayT|nr:hypothetical protein [Desulfobaccales bacterium]